MMRPVVLQIGGNVLVVAGMVNGDLGENNALNQLSYGNDVASLNAGPA